MLAAGATLLLIITACGPFGGDDADPTATPIPTEASQPTSAPTSEPEATTSGTDSQSTPAEDSQSTPAAKDALEPPNARLIAGDQSIEAAFGTYGWQFADEMQSFVVTRAPTVTMTSDAMTVASGSELTVELFGEFYDPDEPPQSMKLAIYDFDANSAIPTNQQGQILSNEPVFVKQTAPVQQSDLDVASPSFTLDVPPGHYAVEVVGDWGQHPVVKKEHIMVTWVFNVIVE